MQTAVVLSLPGVGFLLSLVLVWVRGQLGSAVTWPVLPQFTHPHVLPLSLGWLCGHMFSWLLHEALLLAPFLVDVRGASDTMTRFSLLKNSENT